MYIFIAIFVGLLLLLAGFFIGRVNALHSYAKKMLNDAYAGELIIDMTSVDKELFSVDFEKNPKELMQYEYVLMGVKIRK